MTTLTYIGRQISHDDRLIADSSEDMLDIDQVQLRSRTIFGLMETIIVYYEYEPLEDRCMQHVILTGINENQTLL